MSALHVFWVLAVVAAISAGQLLFKTAGLEIQKADTWLTWRVMMVVGTALAIYGLATLLWIHVLRYVPLHKAYVFMSLSFVIVPLASRLVFGESITVAYVIGAGLVVGGLLISTLFG